MAHVVPSGSVTTWTDCRCIIWQNSAASWRPAVTLTNVTDMLWCTSEGPEAKHMWMRSISIKTGAEIVQISILSALFYLIKRGSAVKIWRFAFPHLPSVINTFTLTHFLWVFSKWHSKKQGSSYQPRFFCNFSFWLGSFYVQIENAHQTSGWKIMYYCSSHIRRGSFLSIMHTTSAAGKMSVYANKGSLSRATISKQNI